uniref:Uncharacterized protein n=1 Tax=Rhizophora mucronata TaxID=61149 RepID=A0A2P2K1T6_RHIMU
MMERRPRVWRKEKLAEPGKPDRKMPLSTMAKFSGGIRLSSSPAWTNGETAVSGCGESSRWLTTATSMFLHMAAVSPSPLAAAPSWRRRRSTFMPRPSFEGIRITRDVLFGYGSLSF